MQQRKREEWRKMLGFSLKMCATDASSQAKLNDASATLLYSHSKKSVDFFSCSLNWVYTCMCAPHIECHSEIMCNFTLFNIAILLREQKLLKFTTYYMLC